jgi:hypothetical protein
MRLNTFDYKNDIGWSVTSFPELDSPNTLILVFCSPDFINKPGPIHELARHYPQSQIIGCSSAGEISGTSVNDDSISVAIAQFERTPIKIAKEVIKSEKDSLNIGAQISKTLMADDLRGIFVLSDGLNVNGSELVKGLNTLNNGKITITGGLAGDGSRFKQTWTIFEGKIVTDHVIAVGFYGNFIKIGHGSRGGWDVVGPERKITQSDGNILYELDGQPALQLYKKYLGELAEGLPATGLLFPLAIRKDKNDENQLVRTILSVDEKTQSLKFAGDLPHNYLAQLMHANFDRLISAADLAGQFASKTMMGSDLSKSKPTLAIAISCVGRRLLLGERSEEETSSTLESLPNGTQQVGFYSYGELSPYATGHCDFHNQTMTLTTLTEEE